MSYPVLRYGVDPIVYAFTTRGASGPVDAVGFAFEWYENGVLMAVEPSWFINGLGNGSYIINVDKTSVPLHTGRHYALRVNSGTADSVSIVGEFFFQFLLVDPLTAAAIVAAMSGVRVRITSALTENGDVLYITVGDAYNDDNGNAIIFNLDGLPDIGTKQVHLAVAGSDDELALLGPVLGTNVVTGSGITQQVKFQLSSTNTLMLKPDENYRYNLQIGYGAVGISPRSPVRGDCTTMRKWTL